MRKRLAGLISNALNPFVVALVVILLLTYESTTSLADAFKWSLILTGLCLLPVYLAAVCFVRSGQLNAIFSNSRRQRTKIYLFGCACVAIAFIALWLLGAPTRLLASLVAGLSAGLLFMAINLWWKISVHTAFVTAAAVLLVILYGWMALLAIVIVPLVAWARRELGQHSPSQVVAGALLAALDVSVVFYLFGLI